MQEQTRFMLGGVATAFASIAVVAAVVITNNAALADQPGTSVGTGGIVVPAAERPGAPRGSDGTRNGSITETVPFAEPQELAPAPAKREHWRDPDPRE